MSLPLDGKEQRKLATRDTIGSMYPTPGTPELLAGMEHELATMALYCRPLLEWGLQCDEVLAEASTQHFTFARTNALASPMGRELLFVLVLVYKEPCAFMALH